MPAKIHSFSTDPNSSFEEEIAALQKAHNLTKSAAIRFAVNETYEKRNHPMDNMSLISKAEDMSESFFNKSMKQPSGNYTIVKAQAAEMMKQYASVTNPTLTPEAAVAKVSHEDDHVFKVLYLLASLSSADAFDNLKANMAAMGSALIPPSDLLSVGLPRNF